MKGQQQPCRVSHKWLPPLSLRCVVVRRMPPEPTNRAQDFACLQQYLERDQGGALLREEEAHVIDMLWERQVGPSCGLSALRMLHRHLKTHPPTTCETYCDSSVVEPSKHTIPEGESLLDHARGRGFSNHGEMFSRDNMVRPTRVYGGGAWGAFRGEWRAWHPMCHL